MSKALELASNKTIKFADLPTKAAKVERIRLQLANSYEALTRGLVAIYQRQTAEEQTRDATLNENGVGFSGFDAAFLSPMAVLVLNGRTLTPRQTEVTRKCMLKYAGQLVRIAEGQA